MEKGSETDEIYIKQNKKKIENIFGIYAELK